MRPLEITWLQRWPSATTKHLLIYFLPPSRSNQISKKITITQEPNTKQAEWKRPPSFLLGENKTDATELVDGRRATVLTTLTG